FGGVEARERASTEVKPDPVCPRTRWSVELDARVDDAWTHRGEILCGVPLPRRELRPQVLDEDVGVPHERVDGLALFRAARVADGLAPPGIRLQEEIPVLVIVWHVQVETIRPGCRQMLQNNWPRYDVCHAKDAHTREWTRTRRQWLRLALTDLLDVDQRRRGMVRPVVGSLELLLSAHHRDGKRGLLPRGLEVGGIPPPSRLHHLLVDESAAEDFGRLHLL